MASRPDRIAGADGVDGARARPNNSVTALNPIRRLQNHPHLLERAFQASQWLIDHLRPIISRLGYQRANRWLKPGEELSKRMIFDCRMCGHCILHSTGMTCPMTCPKDIRNGPCGGVRLDGRCEVIPEMMCVWVEAFERSQKMPLFGAEMMHLQPPVNRQLDGTSAWINLLSGEDQMAPVAWKQTSPGPVILIDEIKAWKPHLSRKAA